MMKRSSSFMKMILPIVFMVLLLSLNFVPQAHAHGGGRGGGWGSSCNNRSGGGGGWYSSYYPRNYNDYNCGIHRSRSYYYNRRPMDVFGDFLVDINSLFRQQQRQSTTTTNDDDSVSKRRSRLTTEQELQEEEKSEDEASEFDNYSLRPSPRFEIFQGPNGISELTMAVPGIAAKDLTVEVENGKLLRIIGVRSSRTSTTAAASATTTSSSSSDRSSTNSAIKFEEVFVLDDDMDVDQLRVTLWRGILTIQIPKKVKVLKRIPIHLERDESEDDTPEVLNTIQKTTKKS